MSLPSPQQWSTTPDEPPTRAAVRRAARELGRVLALPLIGLIRFYQLFISPLTPPTCRYYPSCSAYALTAVTRFGPLKGTWLAVRRVLRCHPWAPGGVDYVPERTASAGASAQEAVAVHTHPARTEHTHTDRTCADRTCADRTCTDRTCTDGTPTDSDSGSLEQPIAPRDKGLS